MLWRLSGAAAAGFGIIVVYATGTNVPAVSDVAAVGLSLMVAAAAFAVGALLGLLFGIPRSGVGRNAPPDEDPTRYRIRPNGNLEEISDWLTKILVGVTLVQFAEVARFAGRLVNSVGAGIGTSDPRSLLLAGSLLTYFAVVGFLVGYMWVRLRLPDDLHDAEAQHAVAEVEAAVWRGIHAADPKRSSLTPDVLQHITSDVMTRLNAQ